MRSEMIPFPSYIHSYEYNIHGTLRDPSNTICMSKVALSPELSPNKNRLLKKINFNGINIRCLA